DSPSMYGMMKYGSPSTSPAERIGTMFGWLSFATTMISRWKRATETVAARAGLSTFTTTRRPSDASSATKTRDMPPPPSSDWIGYAAPKCSCSFCSRPAITNYTTGCRSTAAPRERLREASSGIWMKVEEQVGLDALELHQHEAAVRHHAIDARIQPRAGDEAHHVGGGAAQRV